MRHHPALSPSTWAWLSVILLEACAISQEVTPLKPFEWQEICVVENVRVKPVFLDTYTRVLIEKGYLVQVVSAEVPISHAKCPITSTYGASWQWDLQSYMATAGIKVFKEGKLAGQAIYDTRGGTASLGKFNPPESTITELVDQLFPKRDLGSLRSSGEAMKAR
jgi:hypothetical protein